MKKLAIITTHPIQYNTPLFSLLENRNIIKIKVFYTWGESVLNRKYDPGFSLNIPISKEELGDFDMEFVQNSSSQKGSHHFWGIINPTLIDSIKAFNPNALLVYGWNNYSHLKTIKYFKNKIPVFFRGDSTLLDKSFFFKKIIRTISLRWVYQGIHAAFYVGKNNYDYFLSAGLKSNQLIYAPHVVDNDLFNVDTISQHDIHAFKKEIGISTSDVVFLYAGKFENKKNLVLLIQSMVEISANYPVHLLLVGSGKQKELIDDYAKKYSFLHVLPYQSQDKMPFIYSLCHVFVLPSKGPGETWGLSVNEAMANGKPVLVSDKCGCAIDLVTNGINGYIFKSNNKNDLSEKLIRMIENKDKFQAMKKASKEKIKSFNLIEVANTIEREVISL